MHIERLEALCGARAQNPGHTENVNHHREAAPSGGSQNRMDPDL